MESIRTSDLYECCFYLLNGCEIAGIQGRPVNGRIACEVTFKGEDLPELQLKYFRNEACVNLFAFRRAFSRMNSYLGEARRKLHRELLEKNVQGGEA